MSLESLEQRALLSINPVLPLASVSLEAPAAIDVSNLGTGRIEGILYNDANHNAVRDGGESALSGWNNDGQVWIDTNDNGLFDGGEQGGGTGGSGEFAFNNLDDGLYVLRGRLGDGNNNWTTGRTEVTISGGNTVAQNVGIYYAAPATVSGNVWSDSNSNQSKDWDESNKSGVTIYLDADNDGVLDAGETSTTSDVDGNYSFSITTEATYHVRAVLPSGAWNQTTPAAPGDHTVSVLVGNNYSGKNFGLHYTAPSGVISGKIYNDQNNNGVKDAGEPEFNSWDHSARVWIDANDNGVEDNGERGADAGFFDGNYTINTLETGTYILRGKRSGTGWTDGRVVVSVTNGQTTTQNVGLYQAPPASISGIVFGDNNGNGVYDSGDYYFDGGINHDSIKVYLDANGNGAFDEGETNVQSGGSGYTFNNVTPGTYTVRVVTGMAYTVPSSGYYTFTVAANQQVTGKHFGLASLPSISGVVWNDADQNGTMSGSEGVIENATVFLDADDDGVLDVGEMSVQTGIFSGQYTFTNVPIGSHHIRVQLPAGWAESWPGTGEFATVAIGQNAVDKDIGIYQIPPTRVQGYVFNDDNGDGVRAWDSQFGMWNEGGASNVTVFSDVNGNGVNDDGVSTTTDGDGNYTLLVTPGANTIRIVTPSGKSVSAPAAGYYSVSPSLGDTITGQNYGLASTTGSATISGSVWADLDGDGVRDAGENGSYNRTVYLDTNNNGVLDAGEPSTTSEDYTGSYSLTVTSSGIHHVRFNPPAGYVQTSPASNAGYDVTVVFGNTYSGKDFGIYQAPPATISGMVFGDVNGNGSFDGGDYYFDGGINHDSATVYLDLDGDGSLDEGESTASSGTNGVYTFNNVAPGTYTVRVVTSLVSTVPSSGYYTVTVATSQNVTGKNFGLTSLPSISGMVWNDVDQNGTQGGAEGRMEDVTVFLDTDNDGVLDAGERTAVTSIFEGRYTFANVPVGSYHVRVSLPNWVQSWPGANDVAIVAIGQNVEDWDIGIFDATCHISGVVWNDVDGNGTQGGAEGIREGETVFLDTDNDGVLDAGETSLLTDMSGAYSFSVNPGSYNVRVQLPAGWVETWPGSGYTVSLALGESAVDQDFGLMSNTATISGLVWDDYNGNGLYDSGWPDLETDMSGVTLYLDANNNGVLDAGEATAVSGGQVGLGGSYSFTVTPGTYTVRAVAPSGKAVSAPATGSFTVTVSAGQTSTSNNFGLEPYTAVTTISGRVFEDANGNGVYDVMSDTYMNNITLYLDTNNNGVLDGGETSVLSASDGMSSGYYTFTGLTDGQTYVVRMQAPTGKAVSLPAAGYYSITLGTDTNTGRDFAYTNATGSISGYVFKDLDNDGVMDAGEPGMPEATYMNTKVYIDANNNGVFDSGSELYAYPQYPNGDYTFTSLAAGTYTVRVIAPSNYTQGATNGYRTVVVPTSSSAVTGQNLSLIEQVPVVGPKVTAVYVRGSAWNATFLNGLATAGLGNATLGYKVSVGADQLKALPWTNINQISVVFDQDVNIAADDAQLVGVNTASYATTFSYNSTTHVATWTKSSGSYTVDKLLLHISGSTGGATAVTGGGLLDGEWTDSSTTLSGNGTPGGDFNFRLNVLPGDANRSLSSTSADVIQARNAQGTTVAGGGLYTYYKDLNASGGVTSADVIQARNNQGRSLPAANPVAPTGLGSMGGDLVDTLATAQATKAAYAMALDELFSSDAEEKDWLDTI